MKEAPYHWLPGEQKRKESVPFFFLAEASVLEQNKVLPKLNLRLAKNVLVGDVLGFPDMLHQTGLQVMVKRCVPRFSLAEALSPRHREKGTPPQPTTPN